MIQLISYPLKNNWAALSARPQYDFEKLEKIVSQILNEVKKSGDAALQKFTLQFDGIHLNELKVSENEIKESGNLISGELRKSIALAKKNIERFHISQKESIRKVETSKGVTCWRKSVPIEKVGLYIPGGSAPLFSTLLMLGIPAKIAGCKEIIVCSPPDKNGNISPAILFCANLLGLKNIYKIGGVQAIAAMAFGTKSIPKVNKIFGPGNQFVTAAKMMIHKEGISIDLPAGPSELCVIADGTCIPSFVASDLLSQAEHGPDSQVILLSWDKLTIANIQAELKKQLLNLPRKNIALQSLKNSKAILFKNRDEAIEFSNKYAPEHLILVVKNADLIAKKISNAGSVFIGNFSPESAGDYASGTNHTLPTNGYAKSYSGVSLDSFNKKITFQKLSKSGLKNIAKAIETMAEAEGLIAHKNAVSIRIK